MSKLSQFARFKHIKGGYVGSLTFTNLDAFQFFYFLPLVFILLFYVFKLKQKDLKKYADLKIIGRQSRLPHLGDFLIASFYLTLFLSSLIFVFAQPIREQSFLEVDKKAISFVFVVDCSRSMAAESEIFDSPASKLKEGRLGEVKRSLDEFVASLPLGYRLSLVAFAGDVIQLLPFSERYGTFLTQSNFLTTDLFTQQGTNLELAIREAILAFDEKSKVRIVVFLSDGEEEENNKTNVKAVLEEAKKNNVKIYTIMAGRGRALLHLRYKEEIQTYKYEMGGTPTYKDIAEDVWTTPDPKMLSYIAKETGGEFYHMSEKGILIKKFQEILEKANEKAKIKIQIKKDASSYFILAGLVFLSLFMLAQIKIK